MRRLPQQARGERQEDHLVDWKSDPAAKSIFILLSTGVLNVAMVAFHRVASSSLGEDYAQLAVLLGIVNVVTGATAGVGVWLMRQVAREAALAGPPAARSRLRQLLPALATGGLVLAAGLAAVGPWAIRYFHVRAPEYYAMAAAIVLTLYCEAAVRGATQALQHFGQLGWSMMVEGIGRAGAAWLLVISGAGIPGALAGWLVGGLLGMLTCAPGLVGPFPRRTAASGQPRQLAGVALDTACTALYVAVCNLDLFAVQHYFPAEEAAQYARAALVAKALLLAPVAVVTVLMPRVVAAQTTNHDPRRLLLGALAGTLCLLGMGTLGVWLLTGTVIKVMCGSAPEFQRLAPLVRALCTAVLPIAAWQVVLYYHLARNRWWTILVVAVPTAAYALALLAFHRWVAQVIAVQALSGLGALILGLVPAFWGGKTRHAC